MASAAPSKSDIVHFLDNRDDPDVDAAVRGYLKAAYAAGKTAPEKPEEVLELASKVQRKYAAAQVVESGIQNISVPLAPSTDKAPIKRYVQQLLNLGSKAGFEDPMSEVKKAVASKAAVASSAKELLAGIQPYTSPDYFAALSEALAAVEAETGSSVSLDGASAGYKAFAEKVKAVAEAHKLPVKMLLSGEATPEYAAWVQSARVADASAEVAVLQAEATSLLDKHLSKSAATIRAEQAAAMATLKKRIEGAKGAPWAAAYAADLAALEAYDAAVAADPVNPKFAVA